MIDISNFLNELYTPLKSYTGAPQIVKANQKIPPEQLENNRIIYNMTLFNNPEAKQSTFKDKSVVASDDPEFEYDIEIENTFFPEATLSVTGFGSDIMQYINRAWTWFYVHGLGDWWLKDNNWDCVIREVMEIEDRTTFLESDYEKRFGFDVRLQFKDVVKVTYDTIEVVEVTGPDGNTKNIDI